MQINVWLEENLLRVEKPARYKGNELNAIHKSGENVDINIALAFPDLYEVGMSHLGLKILYHIVNSQERMAAERVFAPAADMAELMQRDNIPLFSMESSSPLETFDLIGFTLQYELSYSTILYMLSLSGIPLLAKDRSENAPLIIGGGPCVFNPEPLAEFFDLFLLGDGEEAIVEIMSVCREGKQQGWDKQRLLGSLADIEGVYIPGFYTSVYSEEGQFEATVPLSDRWPKKVNKRILRNLDKAAYPEKMVVPFIETVHDRAMLELFRGCTRGCRFCQAGMIYRPVRERSLHTLEKIALSLAEKTGYEEISLASLSTGDYSQLTALVDRLQPKLDPIGINLSLPSLRIDSFSLQLAERLGKLRKSGLTFAPEAGSQKLRDIINKNVSEEDLINVTADAFRAGWDNVKLYFMLGLPGETDDDVEGIVKLAHKVRDLHRQIRKNNRGMVTVSASTFIPKADTPFQWEIQITRDEIKRRQQLLRDKLRGRGFKFSWHDPETSLLEADFAKGDRRLGKVLLAASSRGAKFDGWSEYFSYSLWQEAYNSVGMELGYYAYLATEYDSPLPWDHLNAGVSKEFLIREHRKSLAAETTGDCRGGNCKACGIEQCPQAEEGRYE